MKKFITLTEVSTYKNDCIILIKVSSILTALQTPNKNCLVTLKNGTSFLVTETVQEIELKTTTKK